MRYGIVGLLLVMWAMIIGGGGIAVTILGPFTIPGFEGFVTSAVKAIVAIVMVAVWILILSKIKNRIFRREIGS